MHALVVRSFVFTAMLTLSGAFAIITRQHRTTIGSETALLAKKKKGRNPSQPDLLQIDPTEANEVPANLRRKVSAPRPALGHIVPPWSKRKGSGGSDNPRLQPQGKARAAGLNNPSMLKILAGEAKGRRLDSPEVYLRPMMGKVKEAVYSTLTSFGLYEAGTASGCTHLDIFAGSGSVGLESLSRGASHCTFVDLSRDCTAAISRNIDWCGFAEDEDRTRVVCAEAIDFMDNPGTHMPDNLMQYDIVTLCPPYEEIIYAELIESVMNSELVKDDTIVLVEYPVELGSLSPVFTRRDGGKMIGLRNRKYGRTVIALYIVNPTGELEGADPRPMEFIEL